MLKTNPETQAFAARCDMKSISVPEFSEWLKTSKRGWRIQYHLGFLCHDRTSDLTIGRTVFSVPNGPADNIGNAVMAAYEAGQVIPVQRKVTEGVYEYIAVRT